LLANIFILPDLRPGLWGAEKPDRHHRCAVSATHAGARTICWACRTPHSRSARGFIRSGRVSPLGWQLRTRFGHQQTGAFARLPMPTSEALRKRSQLGDAGVCRPTSGRHYSPCRHDRECDDQGCARNTTDGGNAKPSRDRDVFSIRRSRCGGDRMAKPSSRVSDANAGLHGRAGAAAWWQRGEASITQ
jgi:hypothetical protein